MLSLKGIFHLRIPALDNSEPRKKSQETRIKIDMVLGTKLMRGESIQGFNQNPPFQLSSTRKSLASTIIS